MDIIRSRTHYGQSLMLDQCGECGGIWVDENELFQIRRGEAAIIESRSLPNLKSIGLGGEKTLLCPRHHLPLASFKDPNFPATIKALKCPVCRNFWFERGALSAWQDYVARRWPQKDDHWVGVDSN